MVGRFGWIVHWIACGLAGLIALLGIVQLFAPKDAGFGITALVIAGLIYGLGRGVRYLFANA